MVKLEHIRNRSGLLLFVIGIAMLAFILTDLLSSQNPGRGNIDMVVGIVGNEEIDYQNFEQRVQQMKASASQIPMSTSIKCAILCGVSYLEKPLWTRNILL